MNKKIKKNIRICIVFLFVLLWALLTYLIFLQTSSPSWFGLIFSFLISTLLMMGIFFLVWSIEFLFGELTDWVSEE